MAGAVYWEWNEIYEFDRGAPACYDGVLTEGLVTPRREETPDLAVFRETFAELYTPVPAPVLQQEALPVTVPAGTYRPLPLEDICEETARTGAWQRMIEASRVPIPRYYYPFKATRKMTAGPCADASLTDPRIFPAGGIHTVHHHACHGTHTVVALATCFALHQSCKQLSV